MAQLQSDLKAIQFSSNCFLVSQALSPIIFATSYLSVRHVETLTVPFYTYMPLGVTCSLPGKKVFSHD